MLRRRKPEPKRAPHIHTSSRDQWENQVKAIIDNITSLEKEYRDYRGLNNSTMTKIIIKNLITRREQLKVKLKEKPPKDRPVDIANNQWVRQVEFDG